MRPAPALQTIARGYSLLSPFNANGCSRCCGTRMFTSSLRNNTGQNTRQREALHLVILGAPGAGKGTHTDSLLRSYVIQALVAGNLLREQVSSKTEIGLKAAKIMKEGGLIGRCNCASSCQAKSRQFDRTRLDSSESGNAFMISGARAGS